MFLNIGLEKKTLDFSKNKACVILKRIVRFSGLSRILSMRSGNPDKHSENARISEIFTCKCDPKGLHIGHRQDSLIL